MPYVEVWVDPADTDLDNYTDAELREELDSRARKKSGKPALKADDWRIPREVAKIALDDSAIFLRKAGRVDLAFKLDETRVDYLE